MTQRLLVLCADHREVPEALTAGSAVRLGSLTDFSTEDCDEVDCVVVCADDQTDVCAAAEKLRSIRTYNQFPVLLATDDNSTTAIDLLDDDVFDGFLDTSWPSELAAKCVDIAVRHVQVGANVVEIQGVALRVAKNEVACLYDQATRDELTELFNRRYFEEVVPREHERHRRQGGSYAILFLDMDDLKAFNERFGHGGGSAALRHVARLVVLSTRSSDYAFRFGGDEFLLLLPDSDADGALGVGQRLCEALRNKPLKLSDAHVTVTASVGLASYPRDGETFNEVVQNADRALFQAKAAGKGRLVAYGQPE